MSKFKINGLEVAVEKFSEARDIVIGSQGRSASGAGVSADGKVKRSFDVTMQLADRATAQAWAAMLAGRGQHFAFDSSLYSAEGLGPDTGYSAILSTTYKFGGHSCYISSRTVSWSLDNWTDYTISAWGYDGTWHHIAIVGGTQYIDGSAGSFSDIAYSSGALTIAGSSYSRIDDLVIMPGLMPISTLASLHLQAFSDLPQVLLSGDFILGGEAAFLPSSVKMQPAKGSDKARVSVRFDEV